MNWINIRIKLNTTIAFDCMENLGTIKAEFSDYISCVTGLVSRWTRLHPIILENVESIEIIIKTKST